MYKQETEPGGPGSSETREPTRSAVRKIVALVIAATAAATILFAPAAQAAYEDTSGYQTGGTRYYATQRYHALSQPLKFDLNHASGECSGGSFSVRPLRTNGDWLAGWVYWNIFGNPYAAKTWAAANTKASGYFTVVGKLTGDCGPGIPLSIDFTARIYF